jgi:hypothetical protein
MILDDSSYGSISFHLTSFQFHYIHFFAAAGLCIPMISLITWPRMDLGLGIANCSSSAGGCQDWVGLAHLLTQNIKYRVHSLTPPKISSKTRPKAPRWHAARCQVFDWNGAKRSPLLSISQLSCLQFPPFAACLWYLPPETQHSMAAVKLELDSFCAAW